MSKKKEGGQVPEWAREIMADAQSYLDLGHEAWLEQVALSAPDDGLDEETMAALGLTRKQVLDGYRLAMEQLASGKGFDADHPLEGLDIDGFHRLASLMCWELKMQMITGKSGDWIIDAMRMEHPFNGIQMTFFNKVPTPSARRAQRGKG